MSIEMAMTDILQQDITVEEFSPDLKKAILNGLFGCHLSNMKRTQKHNLWGDYFDYYHEQCLMALSSRGGLSRLVKCHDDIVRIAQLLRDPNNTRESIRDIERARYTTLNVEIADDLIFSAIDLVVRVSLMIFVGDKRDFQDVFTGERIISWPGGRLDSLLAADFHASGSLTKEHVKMEKLFNARSLERIGGIRIEWTNNLLDHLRVKNDDSVVAIFHYASFLKAQKTSQLWPPEQIDETIRTLALLFPEFDKPSKKWFEKKSKKENLDENAIKCGHLAAEDRQIETFHYWRDRLIVLKQVFDEAEPRGLKRWWRDQRRPVQWYNFWLAVALIVGLTLFFGIVQSIEGGIQVWKAYHPS